MSNEFPRSDEQSDKAKPPRIVMMNTPPLRGTEAQKEFDKKRIDLQPKVTEYVTANERFVGLDIKVTFATKGAASLVALIETSQEKAVLKIPLDTRPGESYFLKVWEHAGITVPHILDEGLIDGHSFILMDYIDAKTLDATHSHNELVQEKKYIDLGRILRAMHRPVAEGYGLFVNGHGEFNTFSDWLEQSAYVRERIRYVEDQHILDDIHGSLSAAKEILAAYVGAETQSSYCHGDFDACNIFDTEPLTVFDPSPTFNNRYVDLARALVIAATQGDDDVAMEQLKEGYFGGESHDARMLQASILLNSYFKLAFARKANRTQKIERIKNYLAQTQHLLTI